MGIRFIDPASGSSILKLAPAQQIVKSSFDVIHDQQGTLSSNLITGSSLKDLGAWSQDNAPVQYDSDTQATLKSVHGGFAIYGSMFNMSQLKTGDLVKLSVSARGRGKLQLNCGNGANYYDDYGAEYNVTNDWKTYRRYYKEDSKTDLGFIVYSSGANANMQVKDIQVQRVDE